MAYRHIPVMLNEVIHYLNCRPGKIYVDGTLGGAGHARAICEQILPDGILIGIDQDIDSIQNAQKALHTFTTNIKLFHGNFISLPEYISQLGLLSVDGILVDIGLSLHQIENSGRGFSFLRDEPLDMRMDIRSDQTAADLVNQLTEKDLSRVFWKYGEERWSRKIVQAIAAERKIRRIETSLQLANIVTAAVPKKAAATSRIHPATRVFMALRIAVNHELERLETFLDHAVDCLSPQGRLCVLSFHSLEDRIVKHRFRALAKGCTCPPRFPQCACGKKSTVRILTRKVLGPTDEEVKLNPMARSTRLRAIEKI